MRISLNEIWNFIDLIGRDEKGWSYALHAGNVHIEGITQETLEKLRENGNYDTELLPEIFTFREILWQPDVFTEAHMSLPGLRILRAFCEESGKHFEENRSQTNDIYNQLVGGLAQNCEVAISSIEVKKVKEGIVTKALGEFRKFSFPIIKFFIYHPQNRTDYYRDAINRLNYAVKIMLTQFYGRYTELDDPYWVVSYNQKKAETKKSVAKAEG